MLRLVPCKTLVAFGAALKLSACLGPQHTCIPAMRIVEEASLTPSSMVKRNPCGKTRLPRGSVHISIEALGQNTADMVFEP